VAPPSFVPSFTELQWVQSQNAEYLQFIGVNTVPGMTDGDFTIAINEYWLWFNLNISGRAAVYNAAELELIEINTFHTWDRLREVKEELIANADREQTHLFTFLRDVFLDDLFRDLQTLLSGAGSPGDALLNFIHPDLAGMRDGVTIGLGRVTEQIRNATIVQENRAFDSITLLLERLDELIAASKGAGGLDRDEWFALFAEGKPISGTPTVQTVESLTPWVEDQNSLWKRLLEWLPKLLLLSGAVAADKLDVPATLVQPILKEVLDQIQNRVREIGEVPPEKAFEAAQIFLTDAIKAGSKAHMLGLMWELIGPPGKALGVTQLSGLVAELAAFGPIAQGTWGRAITSGVGAPAEQQVNSIMRPTLPSEGQLAQWAVKRKLNVLSMQQALRYHGYSERWIEMINATMWTDPSLREITLLASDASVSEFEVAHWLEQAGFEDNDVALLGPVVMQQSVRGQRQALTAEVLVNLKEGFLSEEDGEAQLDGMRYSDEAKRLILDTGRLGFRREMIQQQIGELEQMFNLQQIKEPEFRLALNALGIHRLKIEGIIGKAVSRSLGRISKEEDAQFDKDVREFQAASLAALRAQFSARLIAAEAFFSNLVAIGFLPAIAREIVALEQLRLLARDQSSAESDAEQLRNDIRRARMAAFLDLFRDGFINEDQLRSNLLGLGFARELADAIVFREVALKLEQPKTSTPTH